MKSYHANISGFAYWDCVNVNGKAGWSKDGPMFQFCYEISDADDLIEITEEMYQKAMYPYRYDEGVSLATIKVCVLYCL